MPSSVSFTGTNSILDLLRAGIARLGAFSRHRFWRRRPRRLQLCETLSLGNRGYLVVVRYREQQFLVGGTNTSISMLAQLQAPPSSDQGFAEDERAGS